ncbi:PREDICTED: uncharacterized protein LOC109583079 isoform X2 [Amphimedon queenslandica]|uniref:Death domain-containing protein n=1 Tax=Amphimedon queenslandica TaxID=400682 RepID=A0AAN0J9X9_AMPQE|nr:PREDICTED: uncharacterized protein LOC109583079 isoform X2 [Amphimedon queenslandica]|eukprot:XP_019853809.1 PREDICTED: uncharacterized protein LOC109583079 isoform X2 [Amphimedon queenslandica]
MPCLSFRRKDDWTQYPLTKSLQIPATESELKNELQVSKKQLSALRLENEQSITSFKVKRDELQEEIFLLTTQSLKLQENDKIQQEKSKQFEVLLKELEDSKAALEVSLAESKKSAQTKVLAEHGEVLKADKQIVFNKQVPHIEDVIDLLQRFSFPETKFEELGKALDLKPLLDPLFLNLTNRRSLTDCVIQWIRNSKTKPLFASLLHALRSIKENAIADKLDQEISVERTPDLVLAAFDNHHDNVLSYSLSDPVAVANILYGEGIITAENLLSAIRKSIKIDYYVLEIFADVLSRFPLNEPFGKALLRDYGAIVKVEAKEDEYSPYQKLPTSVEIMVPRSIITDISSIRIAYGKMMYNVGKVLKNSIYDFEALEDFIGSCNSDLKNDLIKAPSHIMPVIKKGCSLIDTSLVRAVAEEFEVSEVQIYIDEYNHVFENFCQSLSVALSLKEKVADSNCQTVTYTLDRKPDENILKDIRDILSKISYDKFVIIEFFEQ